MIQDTDIPAHILRFLDENIDDVPQLETLIILSESGNRAWGVAEVAARNYIPEERAVKTLDALRRRSLVSSDPSGGFRFEPASPETPMLVADVARCYHANISRIATFIHSKPSASVKEFARAFDLKKDR